MKKQAELPVLMLQRSITTCQRCDRLVEHCCQVALEKRAAYREHAYWGKPVPNFLPRDPTKVRLLLLGLAPGAHGANRTGRMFTGDRSGDFLFEALHATSFANQPTCTAAGDGLELFECAITAACHCAPPGNKPLPEEIANCRPFLDETLKGLPNVRGIVALGKIAWDAAVREYRLRGWIDARKAPDFGHGALYEGASGPFLMGTYHPSQQNTFTGKLTQPMLQKVFREARRLMKRELDTLT